MEHRNSYITQRQMVMYRPASANTCGWPVINRMEMLYVHLNKRISVCALGGYMRRICGVSWCKLQHFHIKLHKNMHPNLYYTINHQRYKWPTVVRYTTGVLPYIYVGHWYTMATCHILVMHSATRDMEIIASEPPFAQYLVGRLWLLLTPVASCGILYMGCMLFGIHAYEANIYLRHSSYLDHPHTRACHVHTKNSWPYALLTMGRGCTCPVKVALCDAMCLWYIISVPCAYRMKIHRGYSPYLDHAHTNVRKRKTTNSKATKSTLRKVGLEPATSFTLGLYLT